MSRIGATRIERDLEIPPKSEAIVALEAVMKERKAAMVFAACRNAAWNNHFPLFRAPELLGEAIAQNVLNQIMEQMIAAQSRLVVPPTVVVR